ncbi:hypothetical protein C1N53_18350 [Pontibacter sp. SGAir0037]|nr:hypothetical protein C1N53_18350 [Pontibacter sp. SGAir0037]
MPVYQKRLFLGENIPVIIPAIESSDRITEKSAIARLFLNDEVSKAGLQGWRLVRTKQQAFSTCFTSE